MSFPQEEEESLNETEDTVYVASNKRKVLNLAPPEEVPKNFADYLRFGVQLLNSLQFRTIFTVTQKPMKA